MELGFESFWSVLAEISFMASAQENGNRQPVTRPTPSCTSTLCHKKVDHAPRASPTL